MGSIETHLNTLKGLQAESGLFLASAQEVSTGYNKAWLRDNFYTALAFEARGEWEAVMRVWRAILTILKKHEFKITNATRERPRASWQYIHARYHPETFEEFWEEWGNKQNDAVGAIIFKLADLELMGHGVLESDEDRTLLQKLISYVEAIEYWHDPDSGMWEEGEEIHASSVGAVLAGLERAKQLPFITVPDYLIVEGGATLERLLPRESEHKFCDLALLSLLWPYRIVSPQNASLILKNIEYHFTRRHGVIRYKNDRYYNANPDGWSEEAEWTFGFPWLSIIYAERGERDRAAEYLHKASSCLTFDGKLPELYYSNSERPNENIPLAWSESLYVVAQTKLA